MFVRTISKASGRKFHYVMRSRRDKKRGHPVPEVVSNLTGLPDQIIEVVKAMLKGSRVKVENILVKTPLRILESRYFAPLWIVLHFWLRLEMKRLPFFSTREYRDLTALVLARCVEPVKCRSELRSAEWLNRSSMHLISGGNPRWRRGDFYSLLSKLSKHWSEVEAHLWDRRENEPRLYLYDITSTYFEGKGGTLGLLGYSRDEKRSNPQVVIALVADQDGIPVAIRIFPGNTRDSSTVKMIIEELREEFGIKKAVAIMDRGMRTEANIEFIEKEGLDYIMALPHKTAREFLLEHNEDLQWELFDERNLAEWTEEDGKRYVLCRNPASVQRDRQTIGRILDRAEERLNKLVALVEKGRVKNRDKILARAVKILTQTKSEKYFDYEVETGQFRYWGTERTEWADIYAGCYVLETTISNQVDKKEIDKAYRNQREVEEVFKSCKDELHLRPNFHKKDANIMGHIYLTFLAHYVKKHLELKIRENGCREKGSTFLEKFSDIKVNLVEINGETEYVITEMTEEQRRRALMANIKIPAGPITCSLRSQLPEKLQRFI